MNKKRKNYFIALKQRAEERLAYGTRRVHSPGEQLYSSRKEVLH